MELTSAQRKIAFVVIVLALAGLGFSLFMPRARSTARAGSSRPGSSALSAPGKSAAPGGSTPAGSPGQVSPSPPSGTTGPDIYQWLPFTQPELGTATRTVISFADDYGTFSYSENATGYAQKMRNVITAQLSGVLARACGKSSSARASGASVTLLALRS